jgi:CubicO group peptidase (beta-lactamase class C family)
LSKFRFEAVSPEEIGMIAEALTSLIEFSDTLTPSNGLLVLRRDRVALEHYTRSSKETLWDTQSTTKSFGASLLMIALDEGVLNLSENVCGRDDMNVHHLASMTSGFPKPYDVKCGTPLLFFPGVDFCYSDGGTNILRDVIKRALGSDDIIATLRDRVLDPIEADTWLWDGRFNAGLSITVRDMARYGRLWLRRGDWDGRRIFSEPNSRLATEASNPDVMKGYGYLWWVNSHGTPESYNRYGFKLSPIFSSDVPDDAFMAIGASFTFILVIPSLDLVAVRGGEGFHSIQSGDTRLSDMSRIFVDHIMASIADD